MKHASLIESTSPPTEKIGILNSIRGTTTLRSSKRPINKPPCSYACILVSFLLTIMSIYAFYSLSLSSNTALPTTNLLCYKYSRNSSYLLFLLVWKIYSVCSPDVLNTSVSEEATVLLGSDICPDISSAISVS